jgi:uncharacterized membrane protein YidH (DUF202 family)
LSEDLTRADDIEFIDPGLARERTRLAWTRSAISFLAIGVAILKDRPVVGAPLLIFSVVIWVFGRMPNASGTEALVRRHVLLATIGIMVVSVAALVIALLGHASHGLRL